MIINHQQLKEIAGGKSRAQVAANLKQMGIKFVLNPSGYASTTLDAINKAIGLSQKTTKIIDTEQQDIEL